MAVSLPATVPAGATPIGPIAGAAPGSISTFLYRAYTASGAPYLFAGLPPIQPAPAATATTQPATPSGTVTGAPALTLDPGTLANLIAGIGSAAPVSPGYSGDPGTSYTYDSGLGAVDSGTSSGGGPNLLIWGLVIAAAIAAYLYWKKHHHGR